MGEKSANFLCSLIMRGVTGRFKLFVFIRDHSELMCVFHFALQGGCVVEGVALTAMQKLQCSC